MAVYRYPQEVHDFVKEWAPKLRDKELAEACNRKFGTSFTAGSMKAFREIGRASCRERVLSHV